MVVSKELLTDVLTDYNTESTITFYIRAKDKYNVWVFYQTPLILEIKCGESSSSYTDN